MEDNEQWNDETTGNVFFKEDFHNIKNRDKKKGQVLAATWINRPFITKRNKCMGHMNRRGGSKKLFLCGKFSAREEEEDR